MASVWAGVSVAELVGAVAYDVDGKAVGYEIPWMLLLRPDVGLNDFAAVAWDFAAVNRAAAAAMASVAVVALTATSKPQRRKITAKVNDIKQFCRIDFLCFFVVFCYSFLLD